MTMSLAMRREVVFRVWTLCVGIAAGVSGVVLWMHGERLVGGLGLATSLLHALWMIDARALACGHWRRRPIVIPRLRPRVVTPPRRPLFERLRAWRRRDG
jgi:hypothetical protein